MKITGIKTFAIDCYRTNWVFVKVLTDEGLHGIGEGTLEYKALPQMKYLPLQPLIILKVSRSKFHRDKCTHHREDEKDLMA